MLSHKGKMLGKRQWSRRKGIKWKMNQAQATNDALEEDAAYHTTNTAYTTRYKIIMQHDWLADSGTTSHIAYMQEMFNEYTPLEKVEITGLGDQTVKAYRHGTVTLNFKVNGKIVL